MSGPARRAAVTLREVTADTVCDVCRLNVAPEQQAFVAPNAISIAQAYFEPAAWFRAVYADDAPVGFVMLYEPTPMSALDRPQARIAPKRPRAEGGQVSALEAGPDTCFLWRFMIDREHQGRGYGAAALDLVIAHARTLAGVARMKTSYVPQPGNASPLYERAGFRATGEVDDGEHVLALEFARPPA